MRYQIKILFAVFATVLSLVISASAQEKEVNVYAVKNAPGKTATVQGNLKDGWKPSTLAWAWNSQIACFPATQSSKFTGNHVMFTTVLPAHSIITITVIPKVPGTNLSLYGYQILPDKFTLPTNLKDPPVTCEADHKWDYPKAGKTQTDARTITFNSIDGSYNIMIGVAGPDGATEAEFSLQVALKQ